MQRLRREGSCFYLGRSVAHAVLRNGARISNDGGDETEVSRRHSSRRASEMSKDEGLNINQGGVMLVFIDGVACAKREVIDGR